MPSVVTCANRCMPGVFSGLFAGTTAAYVYSGSPVSEEQVVTPAWMVEVWARSNVADLGSLPRSPFVPFAVLLQSHGRTGRPCHLFCRLLPAR